MLSNKLNDKCELLDRLLFSYAVDFLTFFQRNIRQLKSLMFFYFNLILVVMFYSHLKSQQIVLTTEIYNKDNYMTKKRIYLRTEK